MGSQIYSLQSQRKAAISQLLVKAARLIDFPSDSFVVVFGLDYNQAQEHQLELNDQNIDAALALIRSYEHLCELTDNPTAQTKILQQFDPALGRCPLDMLGSEKDIKALSLRLGALAHEKKAKKSFWLGA